MADRMGSSWKHARSILAEFRWIRHPPSAINHQSLFMFVRHARFRIASQRRGAATSADRESPPTAVSSRVPIKGWTTTRANPSATTASSTASVREAIGEKFPKHIYHSIIYIGALIAHREPDHWAVDAVGAPHVGERTEKQLIAARPAI